MNNKSSFLLITSFLTPLLLIPPFVAHAEDNPVKLDISGHFKVYANYADQDGSARKTDLLRDVDLTFSGETTLPDGLAVGVVVNADGDDALDIEDSFVYFSGNWGRFSAGVEDGSAFMLQVAAPSADDNVDGIETFVNPYNLSLTDLSGTNFETAVTNFGLDYDNDLTAGADKLTYMTPVFSGFQAGLSYTPDVANFSPASRSLNGNNPDDALDEFGDAWEGAFRMENAVNDTFSYIVGAGYTQVNLESTNGVSTVDDFTEWNAGLDLNVGSYGVGVVYTENNGGKKANGDGRTWVLGGDYTLGSMKYGVSWLKNTQEESSIVDVNADRVAVGFVYDYGPGLSFRGSVSHLNVDAPASVGGDVDGTAITVGTQILF